MSRLSRALSGRKNLRRNKPIRRVNAKRKAKRWKVAFGSDERVEWMQQLNCCACGRTPCEVAHVKSRGAGGTADDTIPLCTRCHRQQHDLGIRTFAALHFLDLEAEARKYAEWWKSDPQPLGF